MIGQLDGQVIGVSVAVYVVSRVIFDWLKHRSSNGNGIKEVITKQTYMLEQLLSEVRTLNQLLIQRRD